MWSSLHTAKRTILCVAVRGVLCFVVVRGWIRKGRGEISVDPERLDVRAESCSEAAEGTAEGDTAGG